MADHPAAIAPELTMTTLWPRLRSSTTWAHNLPTDAGSTPPSPLVIDEDPILTTTVRAVPVAPPRPPGLGSRRVTHGGVDPVLALVGEAERAQVHDVTVAHAGAHEGAL